MSEERDPPFDINWARCLNCGKKMVGFPCFGGSCYRCQFCDPPKKIRLFTRTINGVLCLSDEGGVCCGTTPMLRELSREKWKDQQFGPSNRAFRCPRCGSRYQIFRTVGMKEMTANQIRKQADRLAPRSFEQ